MTSLPVLDDVTSADMAADPYPIYARAQQLGPVVHIPALRVNLVTRFEDIAFAERNTSIFASTDDASLMHRVMGHTLMRKDGEAHKLDRSALEPTFRPALVAKHWGPRFDAIAESLIDDMVERGSADLFEDFAAPMASRALMEILGMPDIDWRDLCVWSQTMMDAVGNYANDPEVWTRSEAVTDAINAAIDARVPEVTANPDPSVISALVNAGTPIETIRANTKVVIGGGLNEPRDAIMTAVHGLLSHPDQLAQVQADPALWARVFEESIRWIAPIGMYPRRLTQDVTLGGVELAAGTRLALSVGAACRDASVFGAPELFDINREKKSHLAFGAGPHFCLGTWIARKQVGEIAVPRLFARLPNLRHDPARPARFGGWVFRGALSLPVIWDKN